MAPAGIEGDLGDQIRRDIRRIGRRRIEKVPTRVVEGRRNQRRVRATEDTRLRALQRDTGRDHLADVLDHPELRAPRPGESRGGLGVDGQRDVLAARRDPVLEGREEGPGLPAQDVQPIVVAVVGGVSLSEPGAVAVALERVRARPRSEEVGFEIARQGGVLVHRALRQQAQAALTSGAPDLRQVIVRRVRQWDRIVGCRDVRRDVARAEDAGAFGKTAERQRYAVVVEFAGLAWRRGCGCGDGWRRGCAGGWGYRRRWRRRLGRFEIVELALKASELRLVLLLQVSEVLEVALQLSDLVVQLRDGLCRGRYRQNTATQADRQCDFTAEDADRLPPCPHSAPALSPAGPAGATDAHQGK